MKNDNLDYVANNMKNLLENVTLRKHNILIKIKEDMNNNFNKSNIKNKEI